MYNSNTIINNNNILICNKITNFPRNLESLGNNKNNNSPINNNSNIIHHPIPISHNNQNTLLNSNHNNIINNNGTINRNLKNNSVFKIP